MINFTPIVRPFLTRRISAIERQANATQAIQLQQLAWLIRRGSQCRWGAMHGLDPADGYEQFTAKMPVSTYEELRPMVMRMIAGENSLLWPGRCRRYAQSSGTSDGKSKYIPITADSLSLCHYRGGTDAVMHYLHLYPSSRLFAGKALILGGSFANELDLSAHPAVKVGDLSATLIDCINPLANLVRVPDKRTALMADWHAKLPALVEKAIRADVTNISGVPSWFLTVLREMLRTTGASEIHQIWPRLEVFFHGGIAFGPYREQYDAIIDPARMHYLETYNASEGFFAVQDTRESHAMRLLLDAATFYEFIPVDDPTSAPLPAWEVKEGHIYAMLISSCNGLWRYTIGDTVRIESTSPLRITIAGRTKHFINAFGEEVMVHNTDAALTKACSDEPTAVANYTVAPVYTAQAHRGRHQWLIEFSRPPADLDAFARKLDRCLMDENSDYQAKRQGNIFLDCLSITPARPGLFDDWLESTGKLGGQRKVPRLSNDRGLMEQMLKFNNLNPNK